MRHWIDTYRPDEQSAAILGGKGLNLFRLKSLGVRTAEFGVVSTAAYETYRANGSRLPEPLLAEILASVRSWKAEYVAVRSSMSSEDGVHKSYAGMMESFLYVKPEDIGDKIIACFESMQADRVKIYENAAATDGSVPQRAAVVVQKMVHAAVSGVAFSRAPLGDSALVLIDAGIGLGEGIVSGRVETDAYWVDRFYKVVRREVRQKTRAMRLGLDSDGRPGLKEVDLSEEEGRQPALTEAQILNLSRALLKLEKSMGLPIDIEWAFEKSSADVAGADDGLYLLQVRPITQKFGQLRYYMDINLSESYPGITSPLTASFVTIGYREVFLSGTQWLGIDTQRLLKEYPKLRVLVKRIAGHMYYDLNSYYVMLGTVPAGKKNIENWHRMIGGGVIEGMSVDAIQPIPTLEAIKYYGNMLRLLVRHDSIFEEFYSTAARDRQRLLRDLALAQSSREIARFLDAAVANAGFFGLTALNDTLIMRLTKALVKLLDKYAIPHTILPLLFKTKEGVESLRPMEAIQSILGAIPDVTAFFSLFESFIADNQKNEWEGERLYDHFYILLEKHGHGKVAARIKKYVADYGQRSFEELKLESLTVKQAPHLLYQIMKIMSQPQGRAGSKEQAADEPSLEESLRRFSWLDRQFYGIIRSLLHKAIRTREKTRLIRGEYFGIVRDSLMRFFTALRLEKPELFASFSIIDCFGLSLPTIFDYARGQVDEQGLQNEIKSKLGHHLIKAEHPSFLCAAEDEESYYFMDENFQAMPPELPGTRTALRGQGASRGIVEGTVLRLEDPKEAFGAHDLASHILVTRTTDPAWVFIMAQCCGLVSEKGSLLSHTAIIGREMGIPTVVAADHVMSQLKTGMRIRIDGSLGTIEMI